MIKRQTLQNKCQNLVVMWYNNPLACPISNNLTYRLAIIAKKHQACLGYNARMTGSRDLYGLTTNCGAVVHQTGAIESHLLQEKSHITA